MYKVTTEISADKIATLVVSAADSAYGGSWYWMAKFTKREVTRGEESIWYADPVVYANPFRIKVVDGEDGGEYIITQDNFQQALDILAEKYPQHIADIINGDDDANTGDAFLQCAVFGDIIYG